MNILLPVLIGYVILYISFGLYVLRPIPNSYDLLKIKIRFLPSYIKWIGLIFIVGGFIAAFGFNEFEGFVRKREVFFYNLNTGLLFFVFSKERDEDELFLHLRMKALVVSFINTIITIGILYPLVFLNNEITDSWIFDFGFFLLMLLVYYLSYFYYTKYKSKK
ncbi:hypothetical protein GM418_20585 [Maribellus comscasis]|uniref:Uncharacterized protein n=1 Tax=Maribellus comscasis TaxID=2681766 RepID=A0A6I6JXV8_9BACT|nr:hypothetical protein [Maribellus comscasis]QGY45978.1 hypothetical protein GM418_20585 [Maribellus comscasis]